MTTEPKFKRGCLRDSLNYLAERPGKLITAEEITKATGWDRTKIMHALAKSSWEKNPNSDSRAKNVEKLSTGVWRYVDNKPAEVNNVPPVLSVPSQGLRNEMKVEVLKRRNVDLIVEHVETGDIYKMTRVI